MHAFDKRFSIMNIRLSGIWWAYKIIEYNDMYKGKQNDDLLLVQISGALLIRTRSFCHAWKNERFLLCWLEDTCDDTHDDYSTYLLSCSRNIRWLLLEQSMVNPNSVNVGCELTPDAAQPVPGRLVEHSSWLSFQKLLNSFHIYYVRWILFCRALLTRPDF